MASWPVSLPNPQIPGYLINPNDQTLATNMEVGSPRVRRITTARIDKIPVTWIFTDAQLADFRDWFDDGAAGINGGAYWFTVCLLAGNVGLSSVEARFAGPYTPKLIGGYRWEVSATLEVRYA